MVLSETSNQKFMESLMFFKIYIFLSVFISYPLISKADLASETVYLTWKKSPTTTMTIQWISHDDRSENRIFYSQKDSSEWHEAKGHATRFPQTLNYLIHQVELLSLKPETEYVFKLHENPKEYLFKTMPLTLNSPVRFVVGGDMYHDEPEFLHTTCKQAALFNPSFAIVGGDIAYASPSKPFQGQKIERWIKWVQCWHQEMVTPKGHLIPVIAAVGNHDVSGNYNQTPAQARIFSGLFPMPGPQIYNVLDFSSYLSIFLLDSGHANPVSGKQVEWLKTVLEERKSITNRFAVYHIPAYSSVRPFDNELSQNIRKYWVPHFEQGGIQTAFEHHDHAYKRTHPLLNNKIHPDGIIYLGDGAWGVKKARKPKNSRRKRPYLAKFASERHFIGVILQNDQQTFLSINSEGNKLDECTRKITKQVINTSP